MAEVETAEELEFKWGKKKGIGGRKKDVQFYESFTYDGVEYRLYDCVYLYKEGEPEPEIGKLIKIWETGEKARKVKVLWFFRPCEISKFLGDEEILENELFLASGEGAGLANLNPLEAIAGKCNVLCISNDKENPEPSVEELQMAEFVFRRTFDVGQRKIMDKIEGNIAGVDVKFMFNTMDIQKPDGVLKVDLGKNEVCGNVVESNETMCLPKKNSFKEHNGNCVDSSTQETGDLVKQKPPLVEKPASGVDLGSSDMDKSNEKREHVSNLKALSRSEAESNEGDVKRGKVLARRVEEDKVKCTRNTVDLDNRPTKKVKLGSTIRSSDNKGKISEQGNIEVEENLSTKGDGELDHGDSKKAKFEVVNEKIIKSYQKRSDIEVLSPTTSKLDESRRKYAEDSLGLDKVLSKKMKIDDKVKMLSNGKLPKASQHKLKSAKDSLGIDEDPSEKMKLDDKALALSDGKLPSRQFQNKAGKFDGKVSEVTPCPDVKRAEDSAATDVGLSKKMKRDDKAMALFEARLIKQSQNKHAEDSLAKNVGFSKKMKREDKPMALSEDKLPKQAQNKARKFGGQALEVTRRSDVKRAEDSLATDVGPSKKMKHDDKALALYEGKLLKQSQNKAEKFDGQSMEVTRCPDADRRTWFKRIPWEDRMKTAHEQGTLVLLENLDPSYTSAEVEDIVWHGFKESCTAKMIQQIANSSPHSGQALVIFKTRDAAQRAVRELDEGCLLLSDGRPLVGSIGTPCSSEKKPTFFGHLVIDKLRHQMLREREMKEAVSTSHCSQPNTIEYDMAMEWCLQEERSDLVWNNLYKQQGKELRKLKAELKAK